ncbi:putative glycosyl hydrolase [Rhodotorula sp. JG-1b]|nr:putative glycosyl hydrolase [Rhodotorula sp. JG-1b]
MVVKPNKSGGQWTKSGYTDLADHALIGNMRTAALVSISGTVAQLCLPHFDSPSVFARILDKNHGGHFSIRPDNVTQSKQQYLPSTNILATKFLSDEGVGQVDDYMPLPASKSDKSFLPWLIRHVTTIRGELTFTMECAPAFDYARAGHDTKIDNSKRTAYFACPEHLDLDLRWVIADSEHPIEGQPAPKVELDYLDLSERGHKGHGVTAKFTLYEGQSVTFVLREPPKTAAEGETSGEGSTAPHIPDRAKDLNSETQAFSASDPPLSQALIERLFHDTTAYWLNWLHRCTYKGRWRETVQRAALCLKLLTFAPTGAIVAAPTFSLPEDLDGAGRNWDYRYAWIRDASFTVYALLRLGFTEEADAYVDWLSSLLKNKNADGSLQIMYTIHGEKEIPEHELHHLDGHKGQKPVRIGNGAADHLQLDIYGELLDAVYLAQKLSRPLAYDDWLLVRELVDHVVKVHNSPDLSIWEVRGEKQNFLYSKIMCWVAMDRGLRLADKRSLPCPNRDVWLKARDKLYDEIQTKGYNHEQQFFGQSYENNHVLDAAVLIMPLVFFMPPSDPRFQNTLKAIMRPRDRGGLWENSLVYRYDTKLVDDGTGGGEEGSFSMCTLWLVEALARAGQYNPAYLTKAIGILEDFIGYTNHVGLLSEEISKGGESLGNIPQAFSLVALISTIYNCDRATSGRNFPLVD